MRSLISGTAEEVCFVTFDSLTDIPSLDREGFGEAFFKHRNIDAIHIINRTNVWYMYDDLPNALLRIKEKVAPYRFVVTYGSSMGGYAAIRFAAAIGATVAIAISPQYSVSPHLVPFERRWREYSRKYNRLRRDTLHGSDQICPIILYDSHDLDKLHFDLIAEHYPKTKGVPIPHAGHPAGAMVSETDMLRGILSDIVVGQFDPVTVARDIRLRRRQSGQYLFTLARRLGPHHLRTKLRLASLASTVSPDAAYFIYESLLFELLGDESNSSNRIHQAAVLLPNHPSVLRAQIFHFLRFNKPVKAAAIAYQLCSLDSCPYNFRLLATVLAASGRRQDALQLARNEKLSLLFCASILFQPFGKMFRHFFESWRAKPYSLIAQFNLYDEWHNRLQDLKYVRNRV